MNFKPMLVATAVIAGGLTLTGCYGDDYYGGYGGVAVGYGAPGYYDYGYDPAWGSPYWGWYGDYYYPGTGYYVYDAQRRPHRWNDHQRNYWQGRRQQWRGDRNHMSNNWRGFEHRGGGSRGGGYRGGGGGHRGHH